MEKYSSLSGTEYLSPYNAHPLTKALSFGITQTSLFLFSWSSISRWWPQNLLFSQLNLLRSSLNYCINSMILTCLSFLNTVHRWVSVKTLAHPTTAQSREGRIITSNGQNALPSWCGLKSHSRNHFIWEPSPTPSALPVKENFYGNPCSYLWVIENISSWIMQIKNSKHTL